MNDLDRKVMAARREFLALLTEHCPQDGTKDLLINAYDVSVVTMLQAQQTMLIDEANAVIMDVGKAAVAAVAEIEREIEALGRTLRRNAEADAETPASRVPKPRRAGEGALHDPV